MTAIDTSDADAFLAHVRRVLDKGPTQGDDTLAFWDMLKHMVEVGSTCCLTLYEDRNPRRLEILVRDYQGYAHRMTGPWPAGLDAWRKHWDQYHSARYIQAPLRPYLHLVCRFQNVTDLPCIVFRTLERASQALDQEAALELKLPQGITPHSTVEAGRF